MEIMGRKRTKHPQVPHLLMKWGWRCKWRMWSLSEDVADQHSRIKTFKKSLMTLKFLSR
jgi:hypothetical protein